MTSFDGKVTTDSLLRNIGKTNYAQDTGKTAQASSMQQTPLLHFGERGQAVLSNNPQGIYGAQDVQSATMRAIAADTNEFLQDLGYNYKIGPSQVASVAQGFNNVVAPGMQLAADGAVELGIKDPKGPYAELFSNIA